MEGVCSAYQLIITSFLCSYVPLIEALISIYCHQRDFLSAGNQTFRIWSEILSVTCMITLSLRLFRVCTQPGCVSCGPARLLMQPISLRSTTFYWKNYVFIHRRPKPCWPQPKPCWPQPKPYRPPVVSPLCSPYFPRPLIRGWVGCCHITSRGAATRFAGSGWPAPAWPYQPAS